MTANKWVLLGAGSGFLSVALGAFGAHGLAERLEPRMLEIFRTGAQYQMYHALALVGFGLWFSAHPDSSSIAGWAFAIGSIVFSGSLYVLALSGMKWLGAMTPIGGLAFMVGWLAFAWSAWRVS